MTLLFFRKKIRFVLFSSLEKCHELLESVTFTTHDVFFSISLLVVHVRWNRDWVNIMAGVYFSSSILVILDNRSYANMLFAEGGRLICIQRVMWFRLSKTIVLRKWHIGGKKMFIDRNQKDKEWRKIIEKWQSLWFMSKFSMNKKKLNIVGRTKDSGILIDDSAW